MKRTYRLYADVGASRDAAKLLRAWVTELAATVSDLDCVCFDIHPVMLNEARSVPERFCGKVRDLPGFLGDWEYHFEWIGIMAGTSEVLSCPGFIVDGSSELWNDPPMMGSESEPGCQGSVIELYAWDASTMLGLSTNKELLDSLAAAAPGCDYKFES